MNALAMILAVASGAVWAALWADREQGAPVANEVEAVFFAVAVTCAAAYCWAIS